MRTHLLVMINQILGNHPGCWGWEELLGKREALVGKEGRPWYEGQPVTAGEKLHHWEAPAGLCWAGSNLKAHTWLHL